MLKNNQYLQVIFVDADQIVRADMGELYDMDIKGRPLAYTPFCDNNKDMDGYRFWRQVDSTFYINFNSYVDLNCRCLVITHNSLLIKLSVFIFLYFLWNRVSGKSIYGEDHIISGMLLLLFILLLK